jgi:tellurium resistance protein TerD
VAVTLNKGGNLSLSGAEPGLKRIVVGLGWEARTTRGVDFDLDASAFLLAENGKVRSESEFIFYNQTTSPCGSVKHTGDNRSGAGEGDDEALEIVLDQVPAQVSRIVVCVTIHDAVARGQNFGQVGESFVRIVNQDSGVEIVRFDLSEDYSTETAMIFGEIYRRGAEWKFKAVGQGFEGGLEVMCREFGVDVI